MKICGTKDELKTMLMALYKYEVEEIWNPQYECDADELAKDTLREVELYNVNNQPITMNKFIDAIGYEYGMVYYDDDKDINFIATFLKDMKNVGEGNFNSVGFECGDWAFIKYADKEEFAIFKNKVLIKDGIKSGLDARSKAESLMDADMED